MSLHRDGDEWTFLDSASQVEVHIVTSMVCAGCDGCGEGSNEFVRCWRCEGRGEEQCPPNLVLISCGCDRELDEIDFFALETPGVCTCGRDIGSIAETALAAVERRLP